MGEERARAGRSVQKDRLDLSPAVVEEQAN
jgi:hypothetical protein